MNLPRCDELQSTLRILSTVIVACAVAVTLGGAAIGLWASRAVLRPLHQLAGVTTRIAGGELDTRLSDTDDRDLVTIVASFNSMVDSLQQRIERERRFFGDVSHELRTPLTTLVTGVEVLRRHEADLPERSRRALDLVAAELNHLRRLLDDLLALAKIEAGLQQDQPEPVSVSEILTHTLAHSGRPIALLTVDGDATISGRKLALERAFVNLMDNADQHGQGLIGITVQRQGSSAVVIVDDAGPGVPVQHRGRIFERFATAGSSQRRPAPVSALLWLPKPSPHTVATSRAVTGPAAVPDSLSGFPRRLRNERGRSSHNRKDSDRSSSTPTDDPGLIIR